MIICLSRRSQLYGLAEKSDGGSHCVNINQCESLGESAFDKLALELGAVNAEFQWLLVSHITVKHNADVSNQQP
jgi:hypothetical protein